MPDTSTAEPTEEAGSTEEQKEFPEQESLSSTVHRVAGHLARDEYEGGISTADLAELRRIDPDQPYTPALWKILLEYVPEAHRRGLERERRWAILLMAMGMCAGLHDPATPFGAALAEAEWSELRFVRLLRSRGDRLVKELRRLAQYLASKNQPANWVDAAWLLFVQDGDHAEMTRQRMARAYYRQLYAQDSSS